jgi:hypothetical protein
MQDSVRGLEKLGTTDKKKGEWEDRRLKKGHMLRLSPSRGKWK